MRFFIPNADSPEQERHVLHGVRNHLAQGLGATFSNLRIYSIIYRHDGRDRFATIGEQESGDGEIVMVILYEPERSLYHVCTPNRGVFRDMSILVGQNEIKDVEYFED